MYRKSGRYKNYYRKRKKTKRQYSKVCYKNIKKYEQRRKENTHRVILILVI